MLCSLHVKGAGSIRLECLFVQAFVPPTKNMHQSTVAEEKVWFFVYVSALTRPL
jgi:hypothetical protein